MYKKIFLLIVLMFLFSGCGDGSPLNAEQPDIYQDLPYEIIEPGLYDEIAYMGDSRFFVMRDWDWGIVDVFGNEIVPPGRYIGGVDVHETLMIFFDDDYHYVVDSLSGEEIARFEGYDDMMFAKEDVFIVSIGDERAVIDSDGREIIPPGVYSSIFPSRERKDWIFVRDNDLNGVVNMRGEVVVPLGVYNAVHDGEDGMFAVWTGSAPHIRYGVIDSSGNEIIPLRYNNASRSGEYFIVRENAFWGIYDLNGEQLAPTVYDRITKVDDVGFIVRIGDDVGVLDLQCEELIPPGIYNNISFERGYFVVSSESGDVGIVDTGGNVIFPPGTTSHEEKPALDADGNIIFMYGILEFEPAYADRFIVTERVPTGGSGFTVRVGVMDSNGDYIIQLGDYWEIYASQENADPGFFVRATVRNESGLPESGPIGRAEGFLDINGEVLIPAGRYDNILRVADGFATVIQGTGSDARVGVYNIRRINEVTE